MKQEGQGGFAKRQEKRERERPWVFLDRLSSGLVLLLDRRRSQEPGARAPRGADHLSTVISAQRQDLPPLMTTNPFGGALGCTRNMAH